MLLDDGNGPTALSDAALRARKKPWKIHRPRGNMHDANLYRYYRPDFRELAKEYPGQDERLFSRHHDLGCGRVEGTRGSKRGGDGARRLVRVAWMAAQEFRKRWRA